MRISKNISFKKVSVEDIEKLYRLDNFKQPIKDINPNEHSIIIELPKENDLNEKFIGEPKELKEQSVKRIYLEEVKEKMKDKKEASFKINGNHVSIKVDEETEIMVYNLEQRGTIFFRSESDTHFWEKPILKDKK
tara:strand:+ start:369 stop:773 length:405 start_codon:yes stop_codon:yes gene_type:complete